MHRRKWRRGDTRYGNRRNRHIGYGIGRHLYHHDLYDRGYKSVAARQHDLRSSRRPTRRRGRNGFHHYDYDNHRPFHSHAVSLFGSEGAPLLKRIALAGGVPCSLIVACILIGGFPGPAGAVGRSDSAATSAAFQAGSDPRNFGPSPVTSLDWSGYAVTGPTFASVAGSWVQPTVSCPTNKVQQSAFWIGIDGFAANDQTVEQIGTDADCTKGSKKVPGGPVHYAWYELFPGALVVLPPATYPVAPGDVLAASVHVSGAAYTLVLIDVSHWIFSTTVTTPKVEMNSSAEWIAEAPTVCGGTKCKPQPLANFGSIAFTGASANGETLTAADLISSAITMTAKKPTLIKARPGPLVGGSAFTVTWLAP